MSKAPAEVVVMRFNRLVDAVRQSYPAMTKEALETLRECADYVIRTSGWTRTDFIAVMMTVNPYPRKRLNKAA